MTFLAQKAGVLYRMSKSREPVISIAKSTAILTMLTVIIKAVGFIKQTVISYYFGASSAMDSYLVITDFVSEIGVMFFSSIAITMISIYDEERENEIRKSELISNAFSGLLIFSTVLVIILGIFAKPILRILAPGFDMKALDDLVIKLQLVSILLINICISNICIAILNAEKRFGIAKSIGLIQSGCIIFACVFFKKIIGIKALYYGFAAYYIIENLFLIVNVKRHLSFRLSNPFCDTRIKKLVRLSVPVFIGNAIVQINAMIDKSIASNLETGSVSGMSYGHFIFSTIHSILIASVTTVLYSYFSNYVVEKNEEAIVQKTKNSVLLLIALLVPICLSCCINSMDIVRLIYGRGIFDENAIRITSAAFMGYAFGVVVIAIRDVYIQVLYAYQQTRVAMTNGMAGVAVNILLSILLSKYVGVFGIAMADSVAYTILAIMSFRSAYKVLPKIRESITKHDVQIIVVSFIIALTCGISMRNIMINSHYFIRLVVDCAIIFIAYYLIMLLFKHESIEIVKRHVLRKIKE